MPSRAYTSFLQKYLNELNNYRASRVNALSGLYLISTLDLFESIVGTSFSVNALSGLYLISTFTAFDSIVYSDSVSMPSRAYTSFLRYPFKNLGFMRFPEPVFAGIYQNILTTVFFRAC